MTRSFLYWRALFLVIILAGCGGSPNNADQTVVVKLEPLDFHDKWNQNAHGALLDIRDPALFKEKALWGAVNLDYLTPNFIESLESLFEQSGDNPIFIYCSNGASSTKAAKLLADKGAKELYVMSGGYQAWIDSGL